MSRPDQYIELLERHLGRDLWRHSREVAATAAGLARRYGADETKAYLAGMVHDYGKGYPPPVLLKKAHQLGLFIDRVSLAEPKLLHAPVGAALLPVELGITDPAVINAVAFHTTGRGRMTLLEKVVYLADFIEPGRDFAGVARIRELSRSRLPAALAASVEHTIRSVLDRGMLLHPRTVQFRNSLLLNAGENGGFKG